MSSERRAEARDGRDGGADDEELASLPSFLDARALVLVHTLRKAFNQLAESARGRREAHGVVVLGRDLVEATELVGRVLALLLARAVDDAATLQVPGLDERRNVFEDAL